jgi:uncharacterized membrane protein
MPSSTNLWMGLAGLVYLVGGALVLRRELGAARGWDRFVALGGVFIAAPLAMFAPEHFQGPEFVQNMVPPWMPARWFWAYFVGCALLAAATSLAARRFLRLSSTLLGLMFLLFVCLIYAPSVLRHPGNRFAWTYALRDLSFSAGAWALAGLHGRASAPQRSKWMIGFARIVMAAAATFFGVVHLLHPGSAPGVPLELLTPGWVPFPSVWGYATGAILLVAGISLALGRRARMAAASIGALMTFLTLALYLPILLLAHDGPVPVINEALNYVADIWLFAGAALALASALPREPDGADGAGKA